MPSNRANAATRVFPVFPKVSRSPPTDLSPQIVANKCRGIDRDNFWVGTCLQLCSKLAQEGAAHKARANHTHGHGQCGQVESAMHSTQRTDCITLVQQHCDIIFAATLRN